MNVLDAVRERYLKENKLHQISKVVVMNNEIGSNMTSHTTSQHQEVISMELIVIGWLLLVWIVTSNAVIMSCFIRYRKNTWPPFAKHVFHLTATDFAVGFLSMPTVANGTGDDFITNNLGCSVVVYLFIIAQCACLYHIFGVCIHRTIRMHKVTIGGFEPSKRFPTALSSAAWLIALLVCIAHFLAFAEREKALSRCVTEQLFKNDRAAWLLMAVAYVLPLIVTNVLYLIAVLRLRKLWKEVFPAGESSTSNDVTSDVSTYNQQVCELYRLNNDHNEPSTSREGGNVVDIFTLPIHNENKNEQRQQPQSKQEPHTQVIPLYKCQQRSTHRPRHDHQKPDHQQGFSNLPPQPKQQHQQQQKQKQQQQQHLSVEAYQQQQQQQHQIQNTYQPLAQPGWDRTHRARMKMQRKIFGTIGVITLFFNLFTVPMIGGLIFASGSQVASRDKRYIFCSVFLLNSALNPIIYTLRTDWLKARLRRMLLTQR